MARTDRFRIDPSQYDLADMPAVPALQPIVGGSPSPNSAPSSGGVSAAQVPQIVADVLEGPHDGVSTEYDAAEREVTVTNTDKGSVAVAAHTTLVDPHPQYETPAEVNAKIAAHAAAADPHTQYAERAGDTFTGPVVISAGSSLAFDTLPWGVVPTNAGPDVANFELRTSHYSSTLAATQVWSLGPKLPVGSTHLTPEFELSAGGGVVVLKNESAAEDFRVRDRFRPPYRTPGSAIASGLNTELVLDNDFIHVKTSGLWKSVPLNPYGTGGVGGGGGGPGVAGPAGLAFSQVQTTAYGELLPAATALVSEPFTADTGQFTKFSEGIPGAFTVSGTATVANSAGSDRNDLIVTGAALSMPQCAVQIDVVSRSGSAGGYDNIGVGIIQDANNFILAGYDRIANNVRVQVKIGGTNTFNAGVSRVLMAPFKLGLSMIGNSFCVYVDTGTGWSFVTGYFVPTGTINFKTSPLAGWKAGFSVATPGNSTWVFDNLKSGRFGGFGCRDGTFVTNEDGTPYVAAGLAYFAGSCADGLGGWHQGVFSLDLTTYAVTFVGSLMVARDGGTQNDIAGHIIRYSSSSYRLTTTTWGNNFGGPLDLYSGTTTQDLLAGSFVVTGLAKLTLPTQGTGQAAYDGMLIKIGGTWKLAHSISTNLSFSGSPFYPALCISADLVTWTQTAIDSGARPFEGTKWAKFGASFYITVGSPYQIRVYDANLNFRGNLQATLDGGAVTQPHASILDTGSKYIMLTFNQNKPPGVTAAFTWGELVIHEAPY